MPEQDYSYDVAISLLSQDQEYAERLEQQIRAVVRGEVLLYSSRQGELASNGEIVTTLMRIFRDQARIVVILYRPGWGKTGYTSIEEDAIKSRRARTTSTRFVVVVSMEPPHTPEWYPGDSEFWLDPSTFSPDAIAAVIAQRVRESGGTIGKEGPVARAKRLQTLQAKEDERQRRLKSEGPARFSEEIAALFSLLKQKAAEISETTEVRAPYTERGERCTITYRLPVLLCVWQLPDLNSVKSASVTFTIQDINPLLGRYPDEYPKAQVVLQTRFAFVLDSSGPWGWKAIQGSSKELDLPFLTTPELADWALEELIEHGHENRSPVR
jgi:hypothetical protein